MFYVADEEAAARCVDAKAIKLMGEAAELNYQEMISDEREVSLFFSLNVAFVSLMFPTRRCSARLITRERDQT